MKPLQLAILIGVSALLSGCCDCFGEDSFLNIEFKNYTREELKTVYQVSGDQPDTCFICVDTLNARGLLFVNPNTTYQVKSDSIPLNKTIQVNKIRYETSRLFLCKCTSVTGIDYELDGDKYTSEPIVITK